MCNYNYGSCVPKALFPPPLGVRYTLVRGERLNGIQEVSGSIPLISTKRNPFPKGSGFLLLCGYFYHIQPQIKLGKVDIEINMQFVAPIDFDPTDQAVDNHFLCFQVSCVI